MESRFNDQQSTGLPFSPPDYSEPLVMGILNVTPDSFYDGGRYQERGMMLRQVSKMVEDGIDILDVGAMSTRPGAEEISPEDEKERLVHTLTAIREDFPSLFISLDTCRSTVARWAAETFGVGMINDISGGQHDPEMFSWISTTSLTYVMMHIQGSPRSMQAAPFYEDVVEEVMEYFSGRIASLAHLGFDKVILDPGFGFGKNAKHNYRLLAELERFGIFEKPVMVGLSRKSMIYRELGISPDQALNGTTALHMVALMKGASILRVHDVRHARECVKLYRALISS